MKNIKTTLTGLFLAMLIAVQPIIDGVGYHLDKSSIFRIVFVAAVAALGFLSKDHNK